MQRTVYTACGEHYDAGPPGVMRQLSALSPDEVAMIDFDICVARRLELSQILWPSERGTSGLCHRFNCALLCVRHNWKSYSSFVLIVRGTREFPLARHPTLICVSRSA
jgi:hypothetical protein